MPSLEACEPWVFRRNLLLSVCPAELFPTHQLLLSAEEDALMLHGPFGCTATAAFVLCCNSLPNTECASCGLGLLALCVCTAEVLDLEKPRRLQVCLWCGQQGTGPAAALPGHAPTQPGSAPLCLPGAVFGSWWSTRPEGKGACSGAQAENFTPNSLIL